MCPDHSVGQEINLLEKSEIKKMNRRIESIREHFVWKECGSFAAVVCVFVCVCLHMYGYVLMYACLHVCCVYACVCAYMYVCAGSY